MFNDFIIRVLLYTLKRYLSTFISSCSCKYIAKSHSSDPGIALTA